MTTDASQPIDASELLDTLRILKLKPRGNSATGTWVTGTIGGHRFEAMVFPEHAANPAYELGDSRISKLDMRETANGGAVAVFDRGWDLRPTTAHGATLVDLLAAGLAESVFGS